MQVLSSVTSKEWLHKKEALEGKADPAEQEAHRVLSDLFRCNNLVVLSGLGTSLCVKDPATEKRLAPTMWDLWTSVQAKYLEHTGKTWDDILKLVRHKADDTNLETLLSRCRLAEDFLEGDELNSLKRFISIAETDIKGKVDFLKAEQALPTHLEFLRRVARRSNRKSRAKIFTTNYDRCFEEAGRQGRYVVIDGFSQTQPQTFDSVFFSYDIVRRDREGDTSDFIPNVFHLYKVHGSVDWERDHASGEVRKSSNPTNPLLIYPRSSKYELAFAQPYLEMMSALQAALREPNTGLLVVGFGFNDNHLAEPILSAIRSNLALKAAIVSPMLCEKPNPSPGMPALPGEYSTNVHLKKITSLIQGGDARLSLLGCGFEELIPYIPDIMAETDLEIHLERVRRLEAQ
ncbi:SIR2 family protein [Comamonas testosteroni]|uniref:SIR2 family protein n=1 Tax=Comamonas testosteroni TaxID=285 RepID=UPI0005B36E76|nr:SIR2 family protein [Comamonas testosteroni]